MKLILKQPSPRQREFLRADTRFVAYGGARGGGKSWAVRQKALLMALHYDGIRLLLLRRSYPELRENHILPLRTMAEPAADFTMRWCSSILPRFQVENRAEEEKSSIELVR